MLQAFNKIFAAVLALLFVPNAGLTAGSVVLPARSPGLGLLHKFNGSHGAPHQTGLRGNTTCADKTSCGVEGSAEVVATGIVATVFFITTAACLMAGPGHLPQLMFKLLDYTACIFLAALGFEMFSTALEFASTKTSYTYAPQILVMAVVVLLYILSMSVAYWWRNRELPLVTFTSCASHYVAFVGVCAGGWIQHKTAMHFEAKHRFWASLLCCWVCLVCIICLCRICNWFWSSRVKHNLFQEVVDDMEADVIGFITSWALTNTVVLSLSGDAAENRFLLDGSNVTLEKWQGWGLLIWAAFFSTLAILSLMSLSRFVQVSPCLWRRKVAHVVRTCLVMTAAWAWLIVGRWLFHTKFLQEHDPMTVCTGFAVVCTSLALFMVACFGVLAPSRLHSCSFRHAAFAGIHGASLLVALAWEGALAHALNTLTAGPVVASPVSWWSLAVKVTLALLLPSMVLPVYAVHIKPAVLKAEEEQLRFLSPESSSESLIGKLRWPGWPEQATAAARC